MHTNGLSQALALEPDLIAGVLEGAGVQIGDKGPERDGTGEKKPHDSNVSFPGLATSGLLCHRFGHLHPPAPPQ